MVQSLWRTIWRFIKKTKNRATTSIIPGHISGQNHNPITPMFTAALFTIAKTWKQPRCPLINKEDVVHIYNGLLLSYKQDEIMPFAAVWMHLEMITSCEVSQRQTSYGIAYI